MNDQTEEWWTR